MVKPGFFCLKRLLLLIIIILPVAINVLADEGELVIYSESVVLMDAATGQVLYDLDMHHPLKPASITKIATALLALELGDLGDIITMSFEAVNSIDEDSSQIALFIGERITLEQALYALALESANDAANGIAELIGGTMDNFAAMLTARASALGALSTNFVNAHGLDDKNHYTTAYDMALITREAIIDPRFCKIFSSWEYRIPATNIQPLTRILRSANEILAVGYFDYDGLIASKHGWTEGALNTLVTAAERNGRTLIAVVMKSSWKNAKWLDTTTLLDWGFANFKDLVVPADEITELADGFSVLKDDSSTVDYTFVAEKDFSCLIPLAASPEELVIEYVTVLSPDDLPIVKAMFYLGSANDSPQKLFLGEMNLKVTATDEPFYEEKTAETATDDITVAEVQSREQPLPMITITLWSIAAVCGLLLAFIVFTSIRRSLDA